MEQPPSASEIFTDRQRRYDANEEAKKYLHDWEERYRFLVSVLTSVVWTTDPIGRVVSLQESWSAYTGQTFEEYKNFGWLQKIHHEDHDDFVLRWARARQGKIPFFAEARIWSERHQCYRYFLGKAVPLFDKANEIKEWVGTISDVHDQRMAENALRESEERFRVAIKNAPIVMGSTDIHLRYVWVQNSSLMFGDRQILGHTHLEIFGARVARKFMDAQKKVFASQKGVQQVLTLDVGSESKTFNIAIEPLFHSDRISGVTFAALDISQATNAEASATTANLAKTQFLANMSHEIRTPIGVIMGYSELAKEAAKDNPEVQDYLKSIYRNGQHLLSLIGEILDLAKIEANKIELECVSLNIVELVQEIMNGFAHQVHNKSLEMNLDFSDLSQTTVFTDPTRIRQILNNVIGNAVKFTSEGSIQVKIFEEASSTLLEKIIGFRVEDTGIGLSPLQTEKLFTPFSQGDNSMSRRFGGTGLGLMVSKGLAKTMGGDLQLISTEVGRGSIFELKVPTNVGSIHQESSHQIVKKVPVRLDGARILLIEDSKDNQTIVTTYLKSARVHVDVADDGLQGFEKASLYKYDIILLDIQMPVIDGYETLKLLRTKDINVPVVALTAHALKTEKEKAIAMGFTDYITKPVHRADLIERLCQIYEENLGSSEQQFYDL